jgi:NAD(P)-dependent dehydrogenase (short-subunit alcohol dehydrogenase family)
MVANAGICITKPILESTSRHWQQFCCRFSREGSILATVDDWDRIFSVNARGVFLCYKYAGRQMIKQGRGGRIIGASSVAGKQGKAQR